MPYFFALVSPIVGILADKFGKRSLIMMGCFLLLILTYVIFLLIPQCEEACLGLAIFPMSLLGVYFGVYTSIVFASVPLVAPRQYLATAFGLVSSCRAIGN
jgi:nitrate/nitrite transporter NarK